MQKDYSTFSIPAYAAAPAVASDALNDLALYNELSEISREIELCRASI